MHRAYRGEPCPGGDCDRVSAANPDAGGGDGHLPHKTDQVSARVRYIELHDRNSRSVLVTRETMRPGTVLIGDLAIGSVAHVAPDEPMCCAVQCGLPASTPFTSVWTDGHGW